MKQNMILVQVLRILMLVFPLGTLATLTALLAAAPPPYPVAKPDCVDTCGGIFIPFPFGLGKGCFLDEWYEVVCVNNSTPRLKKLDLDVLNISLPQSGFNDDSTITVIYPIVYSKFSCRRNGAHEPLTFMGSPFTFSEKQNIFVAVGCDNVAIMGSTMDPSFVGCRTQCKGSNTRQYSACSGYDCCYSTIPSGLQGYTVDFQNENSEATLTGDHDCQSAFLIQNSWFQLDKSDNLYALPRGDYVPVVLEWGITNVYFLRSLGLPIDPSSWNSSIPSYCKTVSYINRNSTPFVKCYCDYGYYGNTYLHDGCQDINECDIPELNRCPDPSKCRNMRGSYYCAKEKGTAMFVVIGLFSGFGLLILIFVAWLTYKHLKEKFFKCHGGLILEQQLSSMSDIHPLLPSETL